MYCILLHCLSLSLILLHCLSLSLILLHCLSLSLILLHCLSLSVILLHCLSLSVVLLHCLSLHTTAVKCGANEEFKVEKGVCIKNCEGKPLDLLCKENDPSYITVQCQCVEGFVRHGEACIPKEECSKLISCEIEGMVTPLPVSNDWDISLS